MSREQLAKESKNIQIWTIDSYTNKQKADLFKEKLQKIIDTKVFDEKKSAVVILAMNNLNEDFFANSINQKN